jgi:hypothetical protein
VPLSKWFIADSRSGIRELPLVALSARHTFVRDPQSEGPTGSNGSALSARRKIEEKAGGLVGQRVAVYWPREEMWYPGVVKEFRKEEGSGRLRRGGKYGHFIRCG